MLASPEPLLASSDGLSPDGVSTPLFASSPFSEATSPHHAIVAVKQLRRDLESLQRSLDCERECKQRAVQVLAEFEAMHSKRCEEYAETIEKQSRQHTKDLADVAAVHQSAFEAQSVEVARLERKCGRLEDRVTDLAKQLLAAKDDELQAKQALQSVTQELSDLKRRIPEGMSGSQSDLAPTAPGMGVVIHAAKLVHACDLERLSLEVSYLRQQLSEEKNYSEALQAATNETMLRYKTVQAKHDALLLDRDTTVTRHGEELERMRTNHLKEIAKLKQEIKWVSAEWDQRLEEALSAQKLQFDAKLSETMSKARDRERDLQVSARQERCKLQDAVKAAKVELSSYKNRCQLFDRIAKLQNVKLLKSMLTVINMHASMVKQGRLAAERIASLEKTLAAAQTEASEEAAKRAVLMRDFQRKLEHDQDSRKVLLDGLVEIHRDTGLEYKGQTGSHFRKLAVLQQRLKALEVESSSKSCEVKSAEDQVRKLENELNLLSRQSMMKDGGEIDLTLSRRKRRVNDEYETALERVKRLLEEQAILSARLTGASSELQAQERAFHDWEATVLRNVLDGLRGIIQRASEWK